MNEELAIIGHVLQGKNPTQVTERWIELKKYIQHPLVFSDRNNQIIALCLDEMINADMAIDVYSLGDELQKISYRRAVDKLRSLRGSGEFDLTNLNTHPEANQEDAVLNHIGGFLKLHEIHSTFIASKTVPKTAKAVAQKYVARRSVALMKKSMFDLGEPGANTADLIDDLIVKLGNISEPELSTVSLRDAAVEHLNRLPLSDDDYSDAYWPLQRLNETLPMRRGSLTVLAGGPGSGKTSLAAQTAYITAYKQGQGSVLYVTLEMDASEITDLLIGQEMKHSVQLLSRKVIKAGCESHYKDVIAHMQEHNGIQILDKEDTTHQDIMKAAKLMQIRGNLKLIVVDHIHIMKGGPKQSEYERISDISRALKQIAKATGAAVLGLCQLNRSSVSGNHDSNGNAKEDREPTNAALRGSGSIEQDANAVAMIWNRSNDGEAVQHKTLCITKNRKGPKAKIHMNFFASAGQRFDIKIMEDEI